MNWKWGPKKEKTDTVQDTKNPNFSGQQFWFPIADEHNEKLTAEVFKSGAVGNTSLGKITFSVKSVVKNGYVRNIYDMPGSAEGQMSVVMEYFRVDLHPEQTVDEKEAARVAAARLKMGLEAEAEEAQKIAGPMEIDTRFVSLEGIGAGTLTIHMIEGKTLRASDTNGLSDPYFQLKIGTVKRTGKPINDTLNPKWNEKNAFRIEDPTMFDEKKNRKVHKMRIKILDKDRFGKDESLGEVYVDFKRVIFALRSKKPIKNVTLPLEGDYAENGKITFSMDFNPDVPLPEPEPEPEEKKELEKEPEKEPAKVPE